MQHAQGPYQRHSSYVYARHWMWYCVLSVCMVVVTPYHAAGSAKTTARVLAFTDFHGRLKEGPLDPGIAKFMGAVRLFQAAHPHSLLLAAGDLFTGTEEADLLGAAPTLAAMQALHLAASAVGNHEFDGESSDIPQWGQGGLHFLSANIKDAQGNIPAGIEAGRVFLVNGMRVGVVGLTATSTKRTTKQRNVGHLTFLSPPAALVPVVARLRKEGAEIVIVLAHLAGREKPAWKDGIAPILRELAQVPGVTVVVSGHSHEEHLAMEGTVPIVQPAYRGRSLAVMAFTREADGTVLTTVDIDRLSQRKAALPVDSEGAAIARKAFEDSARAMQRVVAQAAQDVPHVAPLSPRSPLSAQSAVTRPISPLGQFCCQAMLDEVGGDVAIITNSALHAPLRQGPITEKHLYQSIPLSNRIMRVEMTGEELARLLETLYDAQAGKDIQLLGVTFSYDAARPQGARILSLTLANTGPIAPDMTLRVLNAGFAVQGVEGIPFPPLGAKAVLLELRLRDVLRDWLRHKKTVY